jgi:hypothetical protein
VHLPLPRRPDVIVGRPAAMIMVACALVHAVGALEHWAPVLSVLTIAVAVVCLLCVPHLWRAPRTVDWVWVTLGSAAMLVLHLIMLAEPAGTGHAHSTAALTNTGSLDALSVLGLALPLMGFGLAWWALGARPRHSSGARPSNSPGARPAGSLGVGVPADDDRPDRGQHR